MLQKHRNLQCIRKARHTQTLVIMSCHNSLTDSSHQSDLLLTADVYLMLREREGDCVCVTVCVCVNVVLIKKTNHHVNQRDFMWVQQGFQKKKKNLKSAFLAFHFAEFAIHQCPPMFVFVIYKISYSVVLGFCTNPNILTSFAKPFFPHITFSITSSEIW